MFSCILGQTLFANVLVHRDLQPPIWNRIEISHIMLNASHKNFVALFTNGYIITKRCWHWKSYVYVCTYKLPNIGNINSFYNLYNIYLFITRLLEWRVPKHNDVIQRKHFPRYRPFCVGYSPVTGEFPTQRVVTRSFDVFLSLHLNKRLSKQWWGWWFDMPSRSLWRHCNGRPHERIISVITITHALYYCYFYTYCRC